MVLVSAAASACGAPRLAKDGTFFFQEGGRGAAIVTANGIEIHDVTDRPTPVNARDPFEPWRAPIGFILPANGRFTETSRATVIATPYLAIVLRPSDTRVPSWGGEVLVRIDLISPAPEGVARVGENVAIVLQGKGEETSEVVERILHQLAGRDRVIVFDDAGERVVPLLPASNRSLVLAAIEKRAARRAKAPDLPRALRAAGASLTESALRQRVIVVGTGHPLDDATGRELAALAARKVDVAAISSSRKADRASLAKLAARSATDPDLGPRLMEIEEIVPASGPTTYRDMSLTFEGTPAPSHVIEASGAEVRWRLDAGELFVGSIRAGESRTEVVRVSVPAWVAGERFHFTVTVTADDLQYGGPRSFSAEVPCVYDDDIERIAKSRHGDVIAYASALATLKRLDAAFIGAGIDRVGGLRKLAELHVRSMTLLARDTKDHAIAEQADMLGGLLQATE